ncbi:hypothetical protein SUGI_0924060 [Cryptomeria japonica]|nr:hypothetical protein SUGI_0924060 [Cryptomeria japonica]
MGSSNSASPIAPPVRKLYSSFASHLAHFSSTAPTERFYSLHAAHPGPPCMEGGGIDSSTIGIEVNPPSSGWGGGGSPVTPPSSPSLFSTLRSSFLNQLIAQAWSWFTQLLIAIGSILIHLFDPDEPPRDFIKGRVCMHGGPYGVV